MVKMTLYWNEQAQLSSPDNREIFHYKLTVMITTMSRTTC